MRPNLLAVASVMLCAGAISIPTGSQAQHPPVVRGTVVDAATGLPIAGVTVRANEPVVETATGSDGEFVLRGLLPGRRTLRFSALGYFGRDFEVRARNGRSISIRIELQPDPLALEGLRVRGVPTGSVAARVIDQERIREEDASDLAELLQGIPGVTITRRGGPGAPATASIRGSSADEVLVLVDGVPMNSLLTGEADLSSISVSGVDRVVVIPGTGSARHGPRALAGVILVDTGHADHPGIEFSTGMGSWDEWRLGGTASGRTWRGERTRIGGSLSAEWNAAEGDFPFSVPAVRGGGEDRRRNAQHSRLSLRGAAELERRSLELRLQIQGMDVSRGMPGPIVQPSPHAGQHQRRIGGIATADGGGEALRWEIAGDLQRHTAAYRDPDPPLGAPYDEDVRVEAIGFRSSAEGEIGTLRLDGGAEVREYDVSSSMLGREAPAEHRTGGIWAAADLSSSIGEDASLSISPGFRVDGSSLLEGFLSSPEISASLSGGRFTAQLSVGNAFSPPALADQFFQEGVLSRPNPDLEPERIQGEVEGSVEIRDWTLGPFSLGLRMSAFRSDVDGMILWMPDHRFVWQPENFDVHRRGWEGEATLRVPERARAQLSVSRARIDYAGSVLDGQVTYRPAATANGRISGRIGPLSPMVDVEYVGRRRTVPGSSLNTLSSYWRTDLALQGRFPIGTWHIEPRVSVADIFDRSAAMLVDYPFPGRSWQVRVRVAPAELNQPESSSSGQQED